MIKLSPGSRRVTSVSLFMAELDTSISIIPLPFPDNSVCVILGKTHPLQEADDALTTVSRKVPNSSPAATRLLMIWHAPTNSFYTPEDAFSATPLSVEEEEAYSRVMQNLTNSGADSLALGSLDLVLGEELCRGSTSTVFDGTLFGTIKVCAHVVMAWTGREHHAPKMFDLS